MIGDFIVDRLFRGVPIDLHETTIVLNMLNALVLLTASFALSLERTHANAAQTGMVPRRMSSSGFTLVKIFSTVPFLVLGGLAGAVSLSFVFQRGWLRDSAGTEPQTIVLSLILGVATIVLSIVATRKIPKNRRANPDSDAPVRIYTFLYRTSSSVGWISGSLPLLFAGLAAIAGSLR